MGYYIIPQMYSLMLLLVATTYQVHCPTNEMNDTITASVLILHTCTQHSRLTFTYHQHLYPIIQIGMQQIHSLDWQKCLTTPFYYCKTFLCTCALKWVQVKLPPAVSHMAAQSPRWGTTTRLVPVMDTHKLRNNSRTFTAHHFFTTRTSYSIPSILTELLLIQNHH